MTMDDVLVSLRKIAAYCEDEVTEEELDELIEEIEATQCPTT